MAQTVRPLPRVPVARPTAHPLVQSGAVRRLALPTVMSLPTDPAEREAVEVSQRVMRMTGQTPPPLAVSARPGGILSAPIPATRPAAARMPGTAEADIGQEIHDSLGSGVPLPLAVQGFMAPRFHADFSGVRIHVTPQAAHLAARLQARAFTYRNHIFFGQNEFRPETTAGQALIAHELTHTIQQSDVIQRQDGGPGIVDSVTGALKSAWDDITDFTDEVGWKLVRTFAPSLEPLINKGPDGIFDWLKERAGAAVDGMFNVITAPVRAVGGAGQQLSAQFQPLVATVQGAVGKIARNDCSPLREAAEEIEHVATELVTPVIEKVQPIVAAVKKVAGDLWDKVGAPVLDVIKEYAAEKWQEIQTVWGAIKAVASAIWDQTAWARELIGKAWTWLKNKLGIGEGAEGQNGLLQWAERKLDSAWTWLKNLLAPFSRQLTIIGTAVGGVLIALSPAGPVLAIGAGIAGAAKGLQWISANWGQGNLIVQSRVYLEKTLIPPLVAAANNLSGTITRMATSITGALHGLATGVAEAARALGGEVLAALAAPIQWVADQITALADWATGELGQVSQGLTGALHGLQTFLQNMLEFFGKIGGVVLDIYGLPVLLAGKIWNWIPACIRDPIVDFLGPIILQQIELFSELGKDKEAWLKTKAEIGNLIKLVFKDHDLVGAVKAAFNLVLRVFNLPPDLLATVAAKAMAAWDTISKKPLDFLKNTVRSLGRGFALLWKNFGSHLKFGLQGWLFSGLKEKNINPPASWTDPKALFFFVLEVLGLSVDHVFDLLKQRFPPERVEALRKWYGRIGRVVDWINKTIDVNKSPAENSKGLIDQAKDFGTSILTSIATWVTTKVGEELAILAASAAASAGLSEVVDVARRIYKALVTAKRWARQLLDMANNTLDNIMDIAGGAVDKVGTKFEGILHQGMPMVIGFLADQVGLGGVGEEMRTIVDKLRAGVDKGILWLIDKVKAALAAVVGAVSKKPGVTAEVLPLHFAGEVHELRLSPSSNTHKLEMASGSFIDLSVRLNSLFNNLVGDRGMVPVDRRSEIIELIGDVKEAHLAYKSAPPSTTIQGQAAGRVVTTLELLGDSVRHFMTWAKDVEVDDSIYLEKEDLALIVRDVGVIKSLFDSELNFGIKASRFESKSENRFLRYKDRPKDWEKITSRPKFLGFMSGNYTGSYIAKNIDHIFDYSRPPLPNPPGLVTPYNEANTAAHQVRGHVVARSLGGSDSLDNIVALTIRANTAMNMGPEEDARKDIRTSQSVLDYTVNLGYSGNPRSVPPTSVTIQGVRVWPVSTKGKVVASGSIANL